MMERRKSAILVADAVGFSALVESDETATLDCLRKLLRDIFEPQISAYRGRIFKYTGDGILVEFMSAGAATLCAHQIQTLLDDEATAPDNFYRLQFRIGINFGDVVAEGEDVLGDGVNIAARLQTVAPPGGIAVSSEVYKQDIEDLYLPFEDHGLMHLKGIRRPIHTYMLRYGGKEPLAALTNAPSQQELSIAVLPFDSFKAVSDADHFADGLTEDIITDLAKIPGFFVIARNSTFAYKGKARDLRVVARELGVKYILEGSLRIAGNRLRVNAQLIDAAGTGQHVWADRYDREMSDVFEVQDLITSQVVTALSSQLGRKVATRPQLHPGSIEAYEICLRARNLFAVSKEANSEALELLNRAIALQPDYAEPHWQLAMVKAFDWLQWGKPQQPSRQQSLAAAEHAVALDPTDSNAQWVLGYVLLNERRWQEAEPHYVEAVRLNPNNADALAPFANFLALTGRPDEAVPLALRALRLNPFPPSWYYWALGFAQTACGRYEDAILTLRRPETYRTVTRRILAAALALSGDKAAAYEEGRYFLEANPDWRITAWLATQPFAHEKERQFWKRAYEAAGLPD